MTDKIILICSVGRSGSTTLQRIINTIPNSNICGENDGAINFLLKFYKSIKNTMNYLPTKNNLIYNYEDFEKNKLSCAWFNSFNYENLISELRNMIIKMFKKNDSITTWGFKEIRYYDNEIYLIDEFIELFPNTKIIIHIKNNIESQSKSSWFLENNNSYNFIKNYNDNLITFYEKNKKISYLSTFEDIFDLNKLKKLFIFLQSDNYFDENKINYILQNKYDEIYWKYNYLLPTDFNIEVFKKVNTEIKHFNNYDVIKYFIDNNSKIKLNYKFDIIIFTIAKNEKHILNEWICYNIMIGFQHIFIYDDQSDEDINDTIAILPTKYKNKVTVFNTKNIIIDSTEFTKNNKNNRNNKNKQIYYLNYFLTNNKNISNWCFFCDCDEFIYINNDKSNILEFINLYDNSIHDSIYDAFYIPWINYGSSFFIDQPKGLVIDNFTFHANKYDSIGKSICKLSKLNYIDNYHKIGNCIYEFDYKVDIYQLPIHINHYQINSVKTYLTRKLRYDIGQELGILRPCSHIYNNLMSFNDINDNSMNKFVILINNLLKINYKKENTNKNNYCNVLSWNNKIIINHNTIFTYNLLQELLTSENLYYLTFDNLKSLNNNLIKWNDNFYYDFFYSKNNILIQNDNICNNTYDDFNSIDYINLNHDLTYLSLDDAYDHYINYGKK